METRTRPNMKLQFACFMDGRKVYEIAHACGIHPNVFSGIRTGAIKATPRHQQAIANALGTTVGELFDEESSVS